MEDSNFVGCAQSFQQKTGGKDQAIHSSLQIDLAIMTGEPTQTNSPPNMLKQVLAKNTQLGNRIQFFIENGNHSMLQSMKT